MNDYRELRINVTPCSETVTDILAQFLSEIGYESFVADETGVTAYVKDELFDSDALGGVFESFPVDGLRFETSVEFVEGRDWNEEWEKNYFQPIVVGDECVIHSSFHRDVPVCRYDIVIDPKMAFGTGHHATTSLILARLLSIDLEGLSTVDMGTGTGILAILAAMRGASPVTAVEIDEFAFSNAVENFRLNNVPQVQAVLGDASALRGISGVQLFIANINRNIITADLPRYAATLAPGATMLLSGFYEADIPVVLAVAEPLGLHYEGHTVRDNWTCLRLKMA